MSRRYIGPGRDKYGRHLNKDSDDDDTSTTKKPVQEVEQGLPVKKAVTDFDHGTSVKKPFRYTNPNLDDDYTRKVPISDQPEAGGGQYFPREEDIGGESQEGGTNKSRSTTKKTVGDSYGYRSGDTHKQTGKSGRKLGETDDPDDPDEANHISKTSSGINDHNLQLTLDNPQALANAFTDTAPERLALDDILEKARKKIGSRRSGILQPESDLQQKLEVAAKAALATQGVGNTIKQGSFVVGSIAAGVVLAAVTVGVTPVLLMFEVGAYLHPDNIEEVLDVQTFGAVGHVNAKYWSGVGNKLEKMDKKLSQADEAAKEAFIAMKDSGLLGADMQMLRNRDITKEHLQSFKAFQLRVGQRMQKAKDEEKAQKKKVGKQ